MNYVEKNLAMIFTQISSTKNPVNYIYQFLSGWNRFQVYEYVVILIIA